jgi:hypothetical protein
MAVDANGVRVISVSDRVFRKIEHDDSSRRGASWRIQASRRGVVTNPEREWQIRGAMVRN